MPSPIGPSHGGCAPWITGPVAPVTPVAPITPGGPEVIKQLVVIQSFFQGKSVYEIKHYTTTA